MSGDRLPRVVFVAGTLGVGGAERQLYYMLRTLQEAGESPYVVSLTRGEHWEERIRALGIEVAWAGPSSSRVVRTANIARLVRQRRPDVVQSSHFFSNLYAVAAARLSGAAEVGAIRSDTDQSVAELGRMGLPTLRTPRLLAVNSRRAIEQAIAHGVAGDRLYYLPCVVDAELFKAERDDRATDVNILSVGRLSDVKRHDIFLSVLRRVIDGAPPGVRVTGTILGDGPLAGTIRSQAAALGLGPDRFTLSAEHDNALELYQRADVFLLTSDYEGTPNVILEAMATSLPIVSFDVGEVPSLVDHGVTGVILEHGDDAGMVATLLDLVRDPERRRRFGAAARERLVARYGLPSLHQELAALYDTARTRQRRRRAGG